MTYRTTYNGHPVTVQTVGKKAIVSIENVGGGWILTCGDEQQDLVEYLNL
jgi:hypothetical protein